MTIEPRRHTAPRAHALADLPIDALLARTGELARRWATALVLARPLDGYGDIPLEDLARDGPGLVRQLIGALATDAELDALTAGGARPPSVARLGTIAGARDAPSLVEAVELLRGVLWEALLEHTNERSARHVADLSDRLAFVCACALGAAVGAVGARPEEAAGGAGEERLLGDPHPQAGDGRPVIIDEHGGVPVTAGPRREARADAAGARAPRSRLSFDERSPERPASRQPQIEIRDERGEEGPAAWIGSIGRALERFRQDGLPFAVLLVEIREIEHLRGAGKTVALARLADQVEGALDAELSRFAPGSVARRAQRELDRAPWLGSLTRETPGRYWLLAPKTNRLSARRLAERLSQAVVSASATPGTPTEVAIGTAICPDDGRDASVLAAHADVGLYADRASMARHAACVDEPA